MSSVSPVQPQLLSRINEALVLRAIRQHGPSTRGELSQQIGVTFPTVAKAVGSLLEARLLEEYDDEMPGPGRPAKRLRLSKEKSQVVGVTVDVLSCEVAAAGFDGVLRQSTEQKFATPKTYKELIAAIVERVLEVDGEDVPILCVGISVVGLVDYRRQEIRLAANLPFLNGRQLARDLCEHLSTDCVLVHDAHALCLAEYVYGEASSLDTYAVLDMSTGIGMGVVVNDMFLTGHSGFAGEMGHVPVKIGGERCRCGRRGCLETVASEWALIERVSKSLGRDVCFDELIALAVGGDKSVRFEIARLTKYLAIAMANVINLFDPQCVFLYGRLFEALPWLRDQLVAKTQPLALDPAFADCRFVHTRSNHLLGAVAAAISAVTSARVHDLHDTLGGIPLGLGRRSMV